MTSYKLYYFNARGAVEPIRIIFAQADVNYEDIRFEGEDWTHKFKPDTPFGRVPVLEVDGIKLAGMVNILRYLGVKFGMAGKDELANAVLGGASDYISDIAAILSKMFFSKDDEKAKMIPEFQEKTAPTMLNILQKHIKSGHFIGSDTLSWVDIHAFCICDNMTRYFGIKLADYPELQKLCDGVAAQPNIKKWLETRPDTHH